MQYRLLQVGKEQNDALYWHCAGIAVGTFETFGRWALHFLKLYPGNDLLVKHSNCS